MCCNIQLTKHFNSVEFFATKTGLPNYPTSDKLPTVMSNITLVSLMLEYFRTYISFDNPHPIVITSAFRSPEVNKVVGGKSTSRHLYGLAVDFCIKDYPAETTKYLVETYFQSIFPCKDFYPLMVDYVYCVSTDVVHVQFRRSL